MTTVSICRGIAVLAFTLFSAGIGSIASARPVSTENRDSSGMPEMVANQPPSSVLQVTGTTNSFNISAQHADVQTVLKLVFEQAHRQFVPDASVSGDVTLYLTNQRFDVVFDSICKQAVLHYEVDKNGIYQIRRDDARLIALIQNRRVINSLLVEQLRSMGYDASTFQYSNPSTLSLVPGSPQRKSSASAKAVSPPSASSLRTQSGAGGFAEPKTATDAAKPTDKLSGAAGGFGGGGAASAAKRSATAKENQGGGRIDAPASESSVPATHDSVLPQAGLGGLQNNSIQRPLDRNGTLNLDDPTQYQAFLKQFRMVAVNTRGVEVPVRDVLQDIGKQAGIGMYIDPSVPTGTDFVMKGSIAPRPLANLLSILCYNAHLEWQLVNGRIFITATPQFKLRLNNSILAPQPPSGK